MFSEQLWERQSVVHCCTHISWAVCTLNILLSCAQVTNLIILHMVVCWYHNSMRLWWWKVFSCGPVSRWPECQLELEANHILLYTLLWGNTCSCVSFHETCQKEAWLHNSMLDCCSMRWRWFEAVGCGCSGTNCSVVVRHLVHCLFTLTRAVVTGKPHSFPYLTIRKWATFLNM